MGIFKLFGQKGFDPEIFEKELTALTKRIGDYQLQVYKLNEISNRLRRGILKHFTIIYIGILILMYQRTPGPIPGDSRIINFLRKQGTNGWLIMVGYPLIEVGLLYLFGYLFKFIVSRREAKLQNMVKRHSHKIEELKKVTNYNATSDLLSKFGSHPCDVVQEEDAIADEEGIIPDSIAANEFSDSNQEHDDLKKQNVQVVQAPQKREKGLTDKLLDMIVGSNDNESLENRYALICKQCLTHNGLAPPGCSSPFKVSYLCPNCGYLNGEFESADDNNPIESISIKTSSLSPISRSPSFVEDGAYYRRPSIVESLTEK